MNLFFVGAADGVTGSMTVVEDSHGKFLVDAGLHQGDSEDVFKNFAALPFDLSEIKEIVLTHAHLDHSGYLPRLVKNGFRGKIHLTRATAKLVAVILKDSARLHENEKSPLHNFYKTEDVTTTLSLLVPHDFNQSFPINGHTGKFVRAGHILGAASFLYMGGKRILFSGDLGRSDDHFMPAPEVRPSADVVVLESTYGDREHQGKAETELYSLLVRVKEEGKICLMASFAVARAQALLTQIVSFYDRHPEYKVPVYVDGPMIEEANKVYLAYADETKMPYELRHSIEGALYLNYPKEVESLHRKSGPVIILSSSGMLTGGRIWRHLKAYADKKETILFLPGHQVEGTPGEILSRGDRAIGTDENEKIHWSGEVLHSKAFSSHADQDDLISWVETSTLTRVFLNHGEMSSKKELEKRLEGKGIPATIAVAGGRYQI